MFQIKAKLLYNSKIKGNYWHCILATPLIANKVNPGQFADIRLTHTFEPFLRRPFSIHRVRGKDIEIIYEVVGKGTEILSQRKPGEYLDIIGPLGNGFTLQPTRYTLLVAGGMGVAPLLFLAEELVHRPQSTDHSPLVLIGAKTKSEILCEEEFKRLGCQVKIATDDGSRGFKGYVSDLLNNLLSTINYQLSTIYACGPRPMLKAVSRIAQKYNFPAQVSLEEYMACGIGACLGCVVKTKDGYQRVCKEGPVFYADKIVW